MPGIKSHTKERNPPCRAHSARRASSTSPSPSPFGRREPIKVHLPSGSRVHISLRHWLVAYVAYPPRLPLRSSHPSDGWEIGSNLERLASCPSAGAVEARVALRRWGMSTKTGAPAGWGGSVTFASRQFHSLLHLCVHGSPSGEGFRVRAGTLLNCASLN